MIPSVTTTTCWPGRRQMLQRPVGIVEGAEEGAWRRRLGDLVPVDEKRRRMPGNRHPNRAARVFGEGEGGDAAHRRVALGEQGAVQGGEGDQRVAGEDGGGAQRVARLRGDRGGAGAAAGDIPNHQHPAAPDWEGVVEVATDLVLGASGSVHRRRRPAGDVRQRRRQESALQGLGDLFPRLHSPLEVGEETGVVERQRHAPGEDPGETGVVGSVAPSRPGRPPESERR